MKRMVESLEEVESIYIHWSESDHINNVLGCDDNCDIEKSVDIATFDSIVKIASEGVGLGYDKTSLSITLKNKVVHKDVKFYLTSDRDSLLKLLQSA